MAKAFAKFVTMLIIFVITCFAVVGVFAKSKINCMVVTFSNATKSSNMGATVARFISSKLSNSPSYTCVFDGKLSYDNLPAALEKAQKRGTDILVAGVVTKSQRMGASATITFDADVRFVSDGAIILDNTYSASGANMNKALDKAASIFLMDMENNSSYIMEVVSK
ncbi:MAG: hypothetical protein NZ901_10245 [Geminocystis sp.]|nr:hypothetical protein [Geminocystis sp.]MCS7148555.1 hypothetical protein [Geminocystis sp.]MDW8114872.1 hypothetical protein [Geminocystis sp.]MDW8464138.1 hypothetical protein [Geminocystis sp.]